MHRLVAVGIGTTLRTADGERLYTTAGFPDEARAFSLGHVAQLELLQSSDLDWAVVTPPPVFLTDAETADGYLVGDHHLLAGTGDSFSYADLALAVLDEIEKPQHHRAQFSVWPS